MPKQKAKPFDEEDLDQFLEDGDTDLENWVDDYLMMLTAVLDGPKKGYNFRFFGKQMYVTLPTSIWELVDEVAYRENTTKAQFLESSVFLSILLRLKATKELGEEGTSWLKLRAIRKRLIASKTMRDVEEILSLVEADAKFWLAQERPDSLWKSMHQLVDTVDAIKDQDLKVAAIRTIVEKWEFCPAGAAYLAAQGHSQGTLLGKIFESWEQMANAKK